jgi:hypothetical protein
MFERGINRKEVVLRLLCGRQSFAAALRNNPHQQQLPVVTMEAPSLTEHHQKEACQTAQALNVSNVSLDSMFRAATAVQLIMTEFNGAVSEKAKIAAIKKLS